MRRYKVIASGPWHPAVPNMSLAWRVVLAAWLDREGGVDKFSVHRQFHDSDGRRELYWGHYFHFGDPQSREGGSTDDRRRSAFKEAATMFVDKVKETLPTEDDYHYLSLDDPK